MIVSEIMTTKLMIVRAILLLGTINPAPLLPGLQEAKIEYMFADPLEEGNIHA